jgi:hypothetical protein
LCDAYNRGLVGPIARHDRSPPPKTKAKVSGRSPSTRSCIGITAPSTAASIVDLAVAIAESKRARSSPARLLRLSCLLGPRLRNAYGRERQRRPMLTIASTIHGTRTGRFLPIALVGSPRLVGAAQAPCRALASRALRNWGSTRLRRRTDTSRAYVEPDDRRTSVRFCVSSRPLRKPFKWPLL